MNFPIIRLYWNYDNVIKHKARYQFGIQTHKDEKPIHVYFVLASDNLVKIGYSRDVPKRMISIKIAHPTVKLLGTVITKTEVQVHKIFEEFRIPKTEWFRYDDSMLEFIAVQNQIKQI